jgi:hypothetical protein
MFSVMTHFNILPCVMPENITHQGEGDATQLVNDIMSEPHSSVGQFSMNSWGHKS